ncbi:GNAT family N-acetyltransferase [Pseudomonas aeruginosa]|uniref:GNAT family N-acetyltransferase n=1 Tax=Pseudomonas aeruginosa TaxID=287 RepID=UPI00106D55A3|nr:GNAT family N-acetyltransferase [Pseudomonas aeruginosa]
MSNGQNASRSSAFAAVEGDHWVESLDDGRHVLIRPLREEDRERERQFINRLSPATRHFRFLGEIKEASPALLDQLMDIDYQQSMAFVALVHEDGELREVGISRYAACCEEGQCECAVTIADDYQGLGLDAVLMRHLIDVARRNGFRQMYSVDSAANRAMRDLCCALGFVGQRDPDDSTQVIHRLAL